MHAEQRLFTSDAYSLTAYATEEKAKTVVLCADPRAFFFLDAHCRSLGRPALLCALGKKTAFRAALSRTARYMDNNADCLCVTIALDCEDLALAQLSLPATAWLALSCFPATRSTRAVTNMAAQSLVLARDSRHATAGRVAYRTQKFPPFARPDFPFSGKNLVHALEELGELKNILATPPSLPALKDCMEKTAELYTKNAGRLSSVIVSRYAGCAPEKKAAYARSVAAKKRELVISEPFTLALERMLARHDGKRLPYIPPLITKVRAPAPAGQVQALKRLASAYPDNPYLRFRLGKILEQDRQFLAAVKELAVAIDLARTSRPEYAPFLATWLYALAHVVHELDPYSSKPLVYIRQGVRLDAYAEPSDEALTRSSRIYFPAFREIFHCVNRNIGRIREAAGRYDTDPLAATTFPDTVFVYWGQGIDNAPPLVRRCRQLLKRSNKDISIVELDDANLASHITLAPSIRKRYATGRMSPTHYSDCIRAALLSEYGGIWVDATCVTFSSLRHGVSNLGTSGFFAFRYTNDPLLISSWFLASKCSGYLVRAIYEALICYWEEFEHVNDYYLFHYLLASLVVADETSAAIFRAMPFVDTIYPHALQVRMYSAYNKKDFDAMLSQSFIFKMTYKISERWLTNPRNYLYTLGLLPPPSA